MRGLLRYGVGAAVCAVVYGDVVHGSQLQDEGIFRRFGSSTKNISAGGSWSKSKLSTPRFIFRLVELFKWFQLRFEIRFPMLHQRDNATRAGYRAGSFRVNARIGYHYFG